MDRRPEVVRIAEQAHKLFDAGDLRGVMWLGFAHIQTLNSVEMLNEIDADIVAHGAEAACRMWRWDVASVFLPVVDRLLFQTTAGNLPLTDEILEMLNTNRPTLAQ